MKESLTRLLSRLGVLVALLVVYFFFLCFAPESFGTFRNIETIIKQSCIVGTAALGMTIVIIVGGIDLSVGSMIALCTVVIASMLQGGFTPLIACLAGTLGVLLFGLLNGLLITRLRITPFIVTLGTLLVIRGVAKGLADEQKIDAPMTWLNEILATLPPQRAWMIFPLGVWIMLVLALLLAFLLHYTRFGRHIYAVGSNERTARLCGVAVERIKLLVYSLGALFAAIAGIFQFSRLTVGDPTVASGLELEVIAAVVIGGGSLLGGEGSVAGTLVGALIMNVIRSGSSQMGIPNWIQEIITGCIIVIAVAADRYRHKSRS